MAEDKELKFEILIETEAAEGKARELEDLLSEIGVSLQDLESKVMNTKTSANSTIKEIEGELRVIDGMVTESRFESFASFTHISKGITQIFEAIAGSLPPLTKALLNSLYAAVELLVAIATAQYSNPFTIAFAVATTAASITLSVIGAANLETSMKDAQRQIQAAQQGLSGAMMIVGV